MKKRIQNKSIRCGIIILFLHILSVNMLQAQNTSYPVGAIPGTIDVSPAGAAAYTIPIEVVPGTQGMQPNLSIVYNSMSGMGLLGMKWNLSGISAITRCGQNNYYDNNITAIQFNGNDQFKLDGDRLIMISAQPKLKYASEIENFARIIPEANLSCFTSFADDGSIIRYGSSNNSKQLMGTGNQTLTWLVDTITDFNGNNMTFLYWKPLMDEEVLISEIHYTGNLKNSMQPYAKVSFEYTNLPNTLGTNTFFIGGYNVQQTRLLKSIVVSYNNIRVRKYKFNYMHESANASGERTAHLKEIILYGKDDNEQLNATTIKWEKQSSILSQDNYILEDIPDGYMVTGDFNGDGYTDFVLYGITDNQDRWQIYYNDTYGGFITYNTEMYYHTSLGNGGNCYFYTADMNGDGSDEWIIGELVDDTKRRFLFEFDEEKIIIDNFYQLHFGDFDGDGKTDILFVKRNPSNLNCSFQLYQSGYLYSISLYPQSDCKVRIGDFDGNGKTDIELHLANGELQTYYCSGGQFYQFFKSTPAPTANYFCDRYSGDFNGDGITDLLTYEQQGSGLSWKLFFGKGDGKYTEGTTISGLQTQNEYLNGYVVPRYKIMIADMDGDGKDDIIQLTGSILTVIYSKGCVYEYGNFTFKYQSETHSLYQSYSGLGNFIIADMNNDGFLDLVGKSDGYTGKQTIYYLHDKLYDFPTEIVDGMGKKYQFTFSPKYSYAKGYDGRSFQTKRYFHNLLSNLKISNGLDSGLNSMNYAYNGAVYSPLKNTFLGFEEVVCENIQENKKEVFSYFVDSEGTSNSKHTLVPYLHSIFYNDTVSMVTDHNIRLLTLSNKRYMPFNNPIISDKLSRVTVKTSNVLDEATGRLKTSTTYTERRVGKYFLIDSFLTETTDYTYKTMTISTNQTKTVLEKKLTSKNYIGSPVLVMDTLTYKYTDSGTDKGRLAWERKGNYHGTITTSYGDYKPAGVYGSKTLSAAGCDSRTETYEYDATRRFVTKITNPLGHISEFIYDVKTGNKLLETDPGNLTTTYKYDSFGNLIQINYPDGTYTNISVKWNTLSYPANALYYTSTTSTGKPELRVYYDLLGREVCRLEDGSYFDTRYNEKGQVVKKSEPYENPFLPDAKKSWHEFSYDSFGRQDAVKAPYTFLSYQYDESKVTVTDYLRKEVSYKDYDGLGRIKEAEDYGGKITYSNSVTRDKLYQTTIQYAGGTTTILSDQWGNRLSIEDPDAGKITSEYNGFNELIKQTDARGNITTYKYDKLGRIKQKQFTEPGETPQTFAYTYHNELSGSIGKLYHIGDPKGKNSETFTYNELGRLTKHEIAIDGYKFLYQYDYTANGQLQKLTYPDNFSVNYSYTSTGKLNDIRRSDDNSLIYKVVDRNKYHDPILCEYGNDLATAYDYNNYGLVTCINTGNMIYGLCEKGGGEGTGLENGNYLGLDSTILNYRYAYDAKGLMSSRSESGYLETYEYDNADRLISITSGMINKPGTTQTFNYSDNGNITGNSLPGTYSYETPKPHAVTKIEAVNNTIFPENPCSVTYNVFNQPSQITEGDYRIELLYDVNQQRGKVMQYRGKELELARYYVDKNYELVINNKGKLHFDYIYDDNKVVALHTATYGTDNGNDTLPIGNDLGNDVGFAKATTLTDTMFYIHTDHLGSYCALTDARRRVVQHNRFDPWGNYQPFYITAATQDTLTVTRDTVVYVGDDPQRGKILLNFTHTNRGFTGHEHYPELKIINMNARLYDPLIARFFSPDNYVQVPEFTQSFNRYSYCLNNPLKYVDPSGNWFILNYLKNIIDAEDWVRNLATGEYEWMDNVTSPQTTPKGYRYVGPNDNDILKDLNIFSQTQRQEETRRGLGFDGDELGRPAPQLAKAEATGILNVSPIVSFNSMNRTANNVLGRTFEGVRFEGSLITVYGSSNADAAMNYQGSLGITANGRTNYDVLGNYNKAYCIPVGSRISSASIIYPAQSIKLNTSFQKATIETGTLNPGLQGHPRPINMEFNLMLYPTITRP